MNLAFGTRWLSPTRSYGPMPVCLSPPATAAPRALAALNLRLLSSSAALDSQFALSLPLPILRNGLEASSLPNPRPIESA